MRRVLTDEEAVTRRAIDGRVAFAIVAFVATGALVALLDRVGAPEGLVRLLPPVAVLAALATVGVLLRSMRISQFYAAGRAVPMPYVGFAAVAISVGLALPFVPPSPETVTRPVAIGAIAGLCFASVVLGPYLRRTGAFSIVDLIATRFPNTALRLGLSVVVAAIGAFVGLAGFDLAIGPITELLGIPRAAVAASLAFVLVLIAAPGGVAGIVWATNGAAGVLLAALCFPTLTLWLRGDPAFTSLGLSRDWSEAHRLLAAWQGDAVAVGPLAAIGACFAVAGLLPLLTASMAARDGVAAARSGFVSLLWSALVAVLLTGIVLWGATALSRATVGKAPDRLPDVIYAGSAAGTVDLCGERVRNPAAARTACGAQRSAATPLKIEDIRPRSPVFLANLTNAAGAGAAGVGLLAAAVLAIGLALAAAGFFLCATALGHDLFYRVRSRQAQTSRRLAVTRALLVGTVAFGAAVTGARELDPHLLIGLAATLAAAAILPLLALSVHPRAIGRDGVVALLVGLSGAEIALFAHEPTLDVLLRAAFLGAVSGGLAGVLASFVSQGDRTDSKAFVEAVLHRDGDVLVPDKGA